MRSHRYLTAALAFTAVFVAAPVTAQDIESVDPEQLNGLMSKRPYSPYAGRTFATRGKAHINLRLESDP